MNTVESVGDAVARHHDTLALRVRYLASPKPYVQAKAPLTQTLAALKPEVLEFFGLVEGDVEGGRKEYAFSAHGVIQTDLSQTLGNLAQRKHQLEMQLLEQFIQG